MGLWTINQYQLNVIAVTKLYRLRLKINKKTKAKAKLLNVEQMYN